MAEAVYILCALTSLACAVLLVRGWLRTRVRFLAWSALCFVALALNNVVLFLDLVVWPDRDFSLLRTALACAGLLALTFGLVWDAE